MRYIPHILAFFFFAALGLSIAGVLPFLAVARGLGAMICLIVCLLVIEAAVLKRAVKPPVEMQFRYVTAIAQELLRKGDVCTVDVKHRIVTRATTS